MSNGKAMIIHLIARLIKKTFLNLMNLLAETVMSKLIYLIMQQKLISKMYHMLMSAALH